MAAWIVGFKFSRSLSFGRWPINSAIRCDLSMLHGNVILLVCIARNQHQEYCEPNSTNKPQRKTWLLTKSSVQCLSCFDNVQIRDIRCRRCGGLTLHKWEVVFGTDFGMWVSRIFLHICDPLTECRMQCLPCVESGYAQSAAFVALQEEVSALLKPTRTKSRQKL